MKIVYDPSVLQPSATASSFTSGNGPENAIDGNTTTFWESSGSDSDAVGPWVQVDLTRILKVYQIQITFDSVEVPNQLVVLSSDAPADGNFGTYPNASTSAFDLIATIIPVSNGTNTISLALAKSARYWRFQNTSSTQTRIKDITIYATSNIVNTASRMNINGTWFYDGNNDLLDIDLLEQVSKGCNQITFKINNKNGKYLFTSFPIGSVCRAYVDGVLKMVGTLITWTPGYSSTGGFEVEGTLHDYGDFLVNNVLFQAWAGVPISDSTVSNDILSQGANSILGMILNSAGSRVLTNTGIQQTTGGINTPFYEKADNISAWQYLQKLQKRALSGSWVLQNTGFDQGTPVPATLGIGTSSSDGYWTGFQTNVNFGTSIRDNSGGNPAPSASLDTTAVVQGGTFNATLSNFGLGITPTNNYDGSIRADNIYLYAEVFQPCLVNVIDCNQAASFTFWEGDGTIIATAGGTSRINDVIDIIVETVPSPGITRRLHYLVTGVGRHLGAAGSTLPPASNNVTGILTDVYKTKGSGAITVNLYTDYQAAFGTFAANNDVIVAIRTRVIPFQSVNDFSGIQSSAIVNIDNVSLSPTAPSKIPPVQYDFNVGTDSNNNQTLNWFARPRSGVDLNYRHLDPSNNLKWFTNFPDSDLNNIEEFHFTKGDSYRTKTDVTVRGKQFREATDGITIDASIITTDLSYLIGQSPPHGSAFPTLSIKSSTDMSAIGRRSKQLTLSDTNVSDLSRAVISEFNSTKNLEQRAIVTVKGNANLTPGYVVYVASDYSDIQGYYYIVTAQHKWSAAGYKTTLTLEDDRFRFADDFARIQADISNTFLTAPKIKSKTFIKRSANISGSSLLGALKVNPKTDTSQLWPYTQDRDSLRLPYNFIPELAAITRLTITTTRLAGLEGYGNVAPGNYNDSGLGTIGTGWDDNAITQVPIVGGGINVDVSVSTKALFAQRFTMPSQSSGRMLFRFSGRTPIGPQANSYFQCWIAGDAKDLNNFATPSAWDFIKPGNVGNVLGWIGGQIVNTVAGAAGVNLISPAPATGSTKNIPLQYIYQSNAALDWAIMFVELETGLLQPGQSYWFVARCTSDGQNATVQGVHNTGSKFYGNNYCLTKVNDTAPWGSMVGGDDNRDGAIFGFDYWPQMALTSGGDTTYNALMGTTGSHFGVGNKLTIWDPYTGRAFTAIAPISSISNQPLGTDQQYSIIDMPTSIVGRKNAYGQVDVIIAASAGGATGPSSGTPKNGSTAPTNSYFPYARWDYACTVTYLD